MYKNPACDGHNRTTVGTFRAMRVEIAETSAVQIAGDYERRMGGLHPGGNSHVPNAEILLTLGKIDRFT